jgi:hypothetical protein
VLTAITTGPDGNLWYTERFRNVIGRLTPSAPSSIPTLTLSLNQTRFTAGQALRLTATVTPGTDPPAPVDAYIVTQLPSGEFLSLRLDGSVVPGVAQIAQSFAPFAFSGEVFQFPLTGLEPPGTYQWLAALTEPGTLNVIGRVAQYLFTVGP